MAKKQLTPYGVKVKKRLAERNMTLGELALAVGANENYLTQVIHGYKPGKKYIEPICAILDIKIKPKEVKT